MDAASPPIFTYIGRYSAAVGHDFPPHRHTEWELVYYTAGRARAMVGDAEIEVVPGVLVSTPPGVVHSEIAVGAYANIYLGVDAPPGTRWPLLATDTADGRILRVLDALMAERDGDDRMVALLTRELDLLLVRAGESATVRGSTAELVARAEAAMRARLADPLRVADLAAQLSVAPSTLRAAFVRERGVPPRSQLAALRLRFALGQLRTSTLTLESVARLAGFSSASHLSRQVRAETGLSPGELRRVHRSGG